MDTLPEIARLPAGAAAGDVVRFGTADDVRSAAFFEAHYRRLGGWVRRLVDDDETAHDIASEAFTRLIAKHRHIADPRGYLYTISVNLVHDHWRRTRRERRRFSEIITLRRSETVRPPGASSELRMLVETLPVKLRAVVLLHYYADMPVDDVARHLKRKPGTVKSDLFHARAILRDAMQDGPGGTP